MILEPSLEISSVTSFRVLPSDKRRSIFGFSVSQSMADELDAIMPMASLQVTRFVLSNSDYQGRGKPRRI